MMRARHAARLPTRRQIEHWRIGFYALPLIVCPWHYIFKAPPGMTVGLTAQSNSDNVHLNVQVWIDGKQEQDAMTFKSFGAASVKIIVPKRPDRKSTRLN